MIDIVALVNQLHAVVKSNADAPSPAAVESALRAYQASRRDTVVAECATSGRATGAATWDNKISKFVDTHVLSWRVVQKAFINAGAKGTAGTPAFDFLETPALAAGRVPWAAPAAISAH